MHRKASLIYIYIQTMRKSQSKIVFHIFYSLVFTFYFHFNIYIKNFFNMYDFYCLYVDVVQKASFMLLSTDFD